MIIIVVSARSRWRSYNTSEVLNKLAPESDHELTLFSLDGNAFQRPDAMSVIMIMILMFLCLCLCFMYKVK